MVYGVVEHGCFRDVLFCEILRPDGLARQFFQRVWPDLQLDPSDPLRVVPWPMKTNPTIRMSRHNPSGPMSARWGGDLTIRSLQEPS